MATKVRVQNKVFDDRTAAQLREMQRMGSKHFLYAQGSYSNGSKSAGTHSGGGAVDIRVVNMNAKERIETVRDGRTVGMAIYYRTIAYNRDGSLLWGPHIHGVSIGCPDASPSAKAQMVSYKNGRNALASNAKDPHAALGIKPTTWEQYLAKQKGVAVVTSPTIGRVSPNRKSKHRKNTKRGVKYRIKYVKMVWANGELWLVTRLGTYYLSGKTTRGA